MWSLPSFIQAYHHRAPLRKQGFTSEQIARLRAMRASYRTGSAQPAPPEDRRPPFWRWRAQQSKIER